MVSSHCALVMVLLLTLQTAWLNQNIFVVCFFFGCNKELCAITLCNQCLPYLHATMTTQAWCPTNYLNAITNTHICLNMHDMYKTIMQLKYYVGFLCVLIVVSSKQTCKYRDCSTALDLCSTICLGKLLCCPGRVRKASIQVDTLTLDQVFPPSARFMKLIFVYLVFDAGGVAGTVSGGTSGEHALFVHTHVVLNFYAPPA
jgi:hypothetical protein